MGNDGFVCQAVYIDCRWISLHVQKIILIVSCIVCVLVVHNDFCWNDGSVQLFIMIVGGITCVFSSL